MTRSIRIAALAATLAAAATAPAARAASTDGVGANMRHVANITYADPYTEGGDYHSAGTDLEFATLTLTKADLRRARATFGRRLVDFDPATKGIQRQYALAGSYEDGLHIVDITEPERSAEIATYDCSVGQGDVQVFHRADRPGRTYATFVQDDGYTFDARSSCWKDAAAKGYPIPEEGSGVGGGTFIVDVTDPYAPTTVSFVLVPAGSHNQTVHPSGQYLYNSNADLITNIAPAIEIIDIKDLEHPKIAGSLPLTPIPGLGAESHDITFSPDGKRAYSAALSHGVILDTSDPAHPVQLTDIVDPTLNVWHEMEAITLTDPHLGKRDFLIGQDEFAGAEGTSQCPNGGIHVYDVTGPLQDSPVPVGYWNIDEVRPTGSTNAADAYLGRCTSHVFRLYPKQGLMTIAYYNGGVRVVDISLLVGAALGANGLGMKQLGYFRFPDSDTWAAKAPEADRKGFYLFGDDKIRGFDVYQYKPSGQSVPPGTWLTPAQLAARTSPRPALKPGDVSLVAALCLLERRAAIERRGA